METQVKVITVNTFGVLFQRLDNGERYYVEQEPRFLTDEEKRALFVYYRSWYGRS